MRKTKKKNDLKTYYRYKKNTLINMEDIKLLIINNKNSEVINKINNCLLKKIITT